MKRLSVASPLVIFLSLYGIFHAFGFDCHKAKAPVEKMICADDELMAADYELSYYYETLLSISKDPNEVKGAQLAWLDKRNKCKDTGCISMAYTDRIREIEEYLVKLPSLRSEELATQEYLGQDDVYGNDAEGRKEFLGKYFCCVTVEKSISTAFVKFTVSFPDMGQVLTSKVPATRGKSGAMNFRFVDGWSNRGKGSFEKTDKGFLLKIEEVEPAKNPISRNVLRLYGEYLLSQSEPGACERLSNQTRR